MKGLYLATFGCQMNERDSERIAGLLRGLDYRLTDELGDADLILVNTCSIREKAVSKLYSALGRFKRYKELNGAIIGVGGCVAQQEGERLLKKLPYLDLVFGTNNIHRLPQLLKYIEEKKKRLCKTELTTEAEPEESFICGDTQGRITAFVSITRGCNNFCSYCIVPYVRGREVSRKSGYILSEVKRLAGKGVKEVTLLGQNVNSYRSDDGVLFPELINMISSVDGIKRIRFTTSHPKDISEKLICSFIDNKKLCAHIHLPVQSGSDRILALMNRGYTRDDYLNKVGRLRELIPSIAITTDIIVGFPGETEKDFCDTISLVEKVGFDGMFSFKYSRRPMTRAADMDGQIDDQIKSDRLSVLHKVQKEIAFKKNKMLEGSTVEVLVEGSSKKNDDELTGRTPCNRVVNFPGNIDFVGDIIKVKIKKAFSNSLRGELLN